MGDASAERISRLAGLESLQPNETGVGDAGFSAALAGLRTARPDVDLDIVQ